MPLHRIEHFFVLTDDIDKTRDFYRDALGLTVGTRPQLAFPGYWLYAGEIPCIHVGERRAYRQFTDTHGIPFSEPADGTGPVDHIAFNASDASGIRARLEQAGVDYSENRLDDIGLTQIFVKDPNGITIEMNFRAN